MAKVLNPIMITAMIGPYLLQNFVQTDNAIRINNEDEASMATGVTSAIPTFRNTIKSTVEMDFAAWAIENDVFEGLRKAFQGGPVGSLLGAVGITNPNISNLPFVLKFANSTDFILVTTNYVIKKCADTVIPTTHVDTVAKTWTIEYVLGPQDILGAIGANQ